MRQISISLAVLACLLSVKPVAAGVIYVNAAAVGGNNGTTWSDAFLNLNTGLAAAVIGDQIWIAGGVYRPDRNAAGALSPADNRTKTFLIPAGIQVYGGFAGTEMNIAERPVPALATILSGDLDLNDVNTDGNNTAELYSQIIGSNAYQVVSITASGSGVPSTILLDGLIVTAGHNTVAASTVYGSGIVHSSTNLPLVISNCLISGNNTDRNINANLLRYGGGITIQASNCPLTMTGSTVQGNQCLLQGTGTGGTNNAQSYGGGLYSNSSATIDRCIFRNNRSVAIRTNGATAIGNGAGIYCTGSTITLSNTAVVNNTSVGTRNGGNSGTGRAFGAGLYHAASGGSAVVDNCLFASNSCTTTTTTNDANQGGAIYTSGNCTIRNSTLSLNQALIYSGIRSGSAAYTVSIANSIVWGNVNNAVPAENTILGGSSVYSASYSDIQGSGVFSGTGNINRNPGFVNSTDADGADDILGTADDGFFPAFCAGVVDAGDNSLAPPSNSTDLAGGSRILNSIIDMGAYEKQGVPTGVIADRAGLSTATSNGTSFASQCTDQDGFTYYGLPENQDKVGLAVKWNGNLAAQQNAVVNVNVDAGIAGSSTATDAAYAMPRYWNVSTSGTIDPAQPVTVRFFYAPADTAAVRTAADNWAASASGATLSPLTWFKTVGVAYDPALVTSTGISVANQTLTVVGSGVTATGVAWVDFGGITSFSGGTGAIFGQSTGTALPLRLLSFSATPDGPSGNRIRWESAAESEGTRYELGRSFDGRHFDAVSTKTGAGHASPYEVMDAQKLHEKLYYRLRMSAPGEPDVFSNTVLVWQSRKGTVTVAPVPASSIINILSSDESLNGQPVTVYDMQMRAVSRFTLAASQQLDVSNWPAGIYSLRLPDGQTIRVTKQ